MPAVVTEHVALRTRLRVNVQDALVLLARLEAVIAVKTAQPSGASHGKIDHSSPPWNSQAADAALDFHAWCREAEATMRLRLGFPARFRGCSAPNTRNALNSVTRLAEGSADAVVRENARWLDSWCRRAGIILGEAESAKRLPRAAGEGEAVCPWCRKDTLRQLALAGVIMCIDPTCRDDEGRRPRAQLEYFDGRFELRWQDGVMGTP
jgi:hypothetical protein